MKCFYILCNKEVNKGNKYCSNKCVGLAIRGRKPWNKDLTKNNNVVIQKMAEGKEGKQQSVESNKKRSEKLKGVKRPRTAEHSRKIGLANRDKKRTEEFKENLSFLNTGIKRNEETKAKMKNSQQIAAKKPERILKLRIANLGKKASGDTIRKLVESHKGIAQSKEARQKNSESHKGKKKSEITKLHMRLARQKSLSLGHYPSNPSKSEIRWGEEISKLFGVTLEKSFWIEKRCFDYRYKNYLFELDGRYWHSLAIQKINDQLKEEIAERNNFILIRYSLDSTKDVERIINFDFLRLQAIFNENIYEKKQLANSIRG